MYILLSGELIVSTVEGVRVATILPVTTVGEMGVINGQPRSATVEASKQSDVFLLQKHQFDAVLREDREMRSVVYKNIIDVLSRKLTDDNVRMRDHQLERDRFQGRLVVLERQVASLKQKLDLAVEMAAKAGSLSRQEIEMQISEKVEELTPQVLVVDDESSFRRLVRGALPGFSVVEAADGRQALDVVQDERLDLVLTDIRMPNMDGYGLLRNLRSRFPDLPVVAVSGFVDAQQIEEYDFDAFIAKPVGLDELRAVVERLIGSRSPAEA
jgi:CheY-like chemotaxis protein